LFSPVKSAMFKLLSMKRHHKLHYLYRILRCFGSGDSAVGIATDYGLDDRRVGVRIPVGSRIFTFPQCPDRLWGPPSLLSIGTGCVKLTTHLKLVPRSRKRGFIHLLLHTSSWRNAELVKHRDDFTFYLYLAVLINLIVKL
jgi:hypothetical protein